MAGFSRSNGIFLANHPVHQQLHSHHHLPSKVGKIGEQLAPVLVDFVQLQPNK
jgi:hypothetical protein